MNSNANDALNLAAYFLNRSSLLAVAVWWERLSKHVNRSMIGMEMESSVFAKTVDAHNANRIVGRPTLLLFVKGVMDHGSMSA
jgi:hypothetical protein